MNEETKKALQELLKILPPRFRDEVDRQGKDALQELRFRLGKQPELIMACGNRTLQETATESDISFVVNTSCRYSPWTAASAAMGYITAPGGHRIGLCGDAVVQNGGVTGIRTAR